ncbi:Gfo/Idh/MocA family oxidoreductase [Termitidicoccus mucosus]|uniref:Gfo/Idh/MocA-like oxidoreductase N-terminal domain-containing protein n=1 Tax=Termitidicoccus mucosus TaxID=1184151 RepID=A0A178IMH9_9BACT|nr:hypothetical protein AW736_07640 [Opitutaceae bacterium TSB47]
MHQPAPVSVAIIGISGYGKFYLEHLLPLVESGTVRLVAATVVNQVEEAATCARLKALGCRLYEDFQLMLETHQGTLDLALIPTGIPWHSRMTIAALRAGANVLVEKPLAMTWEEIEAIQSASADSGRFVAVGFQQMYAGVTHQVRTMIEAGGIGRLQAVSGLGMWPRPESYFRRNSWAGRIQAEGISVWDSPITNSLAHFLLMGLHWAMVGGNDDFAGIEAGLYRAQAIESYDTAAVRFVTRAGVRFLFFATHSCRETFDPMLVLEGTQGRIVRTLDSCVLERADGTRAMMTVPNETAARTQMFGQVLRRLRHPDQPICGPEEAALHTRCVSAVHHASTVQDVPAALIRRESAGGNSDAQVSIVGIEPALFRAFAERRLPSEIGFPWCRPAAVH